MASNIINTDKFLQLMLGLGLEDIRSPEVAKCDCDNYHGVLLEVSGDLPAARRFYSRAMDGGSLDGKFNVGRTLESDGRLIPKGIGMSLMQSAAFLGSSPAQFFLGGQSLSRETLDLTEAEYWLNLSRKRIFVANMPYAAVLLFQGRSSDARVVLKSAARTNAQMVLPFVRSLRANLASYRRDNTVIFNSWPGYTSTTNKKSADEDKLKLPKSKVVRFRKTI